MILKSESNSIVYKLFKKIIEIFGIKKYLYTEKRNSKREVRSLPISCFVNVKVKNRENNKDLREEILPSVHDMSKKGFGIYWPRKWKCLLCEHRIDLNNSNICQLEDCVVEVDKLKEGADVILSVQVGTKVFDNIEANIRWYQETMDGTSHSDRLGVVLKEDEIPE